MAIRNGLLENGFLTGTIVMLKLNLGIATLFAFFIVLFSTSIGLALPENFQSTPIITRGLDLSTGFEIAPDGRIFITEQEGKVKIYKNRELLSEPFMDLNSFSKGENGLLGLEFDPNFEENGYLYLYYVDEEREGNLIRVDATEDKFTGNPTHLFTPEFKSNNIHQGGTIEFGPDGKLYLSLGDNENSENAQDLTNSRGAILRLNKDGSVPEDNPFVDEEDIRPEIWAYGLRNPFRFQFDSVAGTLWVGDVGHNDFEEINIIEKGKNYGWPICEGPCENPGMENPVYYYDHMENGSFRGASVTMGPTYYGDMFPDEYRGKHFFADYVRGYIEILDDDLNNEMFHSRAGTVVDMEIAPDGSLYYMTIFPGGLFRVTFSTTEKIPVAVISSDKTATNDTSLEVQFTGSNSYDPDGDSLSYEWDFGDGTTSTEPNPAKTYNEKGEYDAVLIVNDGENYASSYPIDIRVGEKPKINIENPPEGYTYKAGDEISYFISTRDGEGRELSPDSITTNIWLHHQKHVHPFIHKNKGNSGEFTIPTRGEPSAETWYRIEVDVVDEDGIENEMIRDIEPETVNININTEPKNLEIILDGSPKETPTDTGGVVNFERKIEAPEIQYMNRETYVFSKWADGGDRVREINTPDSDVSYTAIYSKAGNDSFTGEYYDNKNLEGDPVFTRKDPFVSFNWGFDFSPDPDIPGNDFSVRWTKTENFEEGKYTFKVETNDGARLKINGDTVIDKWFDQDTTTYTEDVKLEGDTDIVLEYYKSSGEGIIRFDWEEKKNPVMELFSSIIDFIKGLFS